MHNTWHASPIFRSHRDHKTIIAQRNVILAGVRIATVTTIGLVTVATLIGMGGLGYLIVNIGVERRFPTATITGVVIVVLLSTIVDLGLQALQRRLTPWARAREA